MSKSSWEKHYRRALFEYMERGNSSTDEEKDEFLKSANACVKVLAREEADRKTGMKRGGMVKEKGIAKRVRLFKYRKMETGIIAVVPFDVEHDLDKDTYVFGREKINRKDINTIETCIFDTYARAKYFLKKFLYNKEQIILRQ